VAELIVKNPNNLAFVTQTTLSVDDTSIVIDALKQHFPAIEGPRKDDICYATQNRQNAVKSMAKECDVLMVVGSKNSSNSNRLRELSEKLATPAYLIDNAGDINPDWLEGKACIGLTAGASAPELLVQNVVVRLKQLGVSRVSELDGELEKIEFSLPKELKVDISGLSPPH